MQLLKVARLKEAQESQMKTEMAYLSSRKGVKIVTTKATSTNFLVKAFRNSNSGFDLSLCRNSK